MTFTITSLNTPFGLAMFATKNSPNGTVAILLDELNPHAALYAAKTQGVRWIIEAVSMLPCDGLLQLDDIVIPDQLVDLTEQRASTFFRNRGYGFVGQHPVWCPDLRSSLLTAAQSVSQRVFSRGTLAVGEAETTLEAAQSWQAHGLSQSAAPAAYLAKELELCYAVVGIVGTAASTLGNTLIAAVAQHLPSSASCNCRQTMQSARDRGLIGDDWRTWIGE
ncbi:hypothetical protein ACP8Y2_12615 [Herpetosiphon llansteffanensis]